MKTEKQYNELLSQVEALRNNLSTAEMRMYRRARNENKNTAPNYEQQTNSQEREMTLLYENYYFNMALNIITYIETPDTLDTEFLEWLLRTQGFATIGGTRFDDLHVMQLSKGVGPKLGIWGFDAGETSPVIENEITYERLTRMNYPTIAENSPVYVTLTNKFTNLTTGNYQNDIELIRTYAKQMARLRITQLMNSNAMRRAMTVLTTAQNSDTQKVAYMIEGGQPIINLDRNQLESLDDIVKGFDFGGDDNLDSLRRQQTAIEADLLTQLGVNSLTNAKAERMNIQETQMKDQQLDATGRVYTNSRKNLLLIAKFFGNTKLNYFIENHDDNMNGDGRVGNDENGDNNENGLNNPSEGSNYE